MSPWVLFSIGIVSGLVGFVLGRMKARPRDALPVAPPMSEARAERLARMVAILNALPDTLLVVDDADAVVELKLAHRAGRSVAVPRMENVTLEDLFAKPVADQLRQARDACFGTRDVIRIELELELAGERRQCEVRVVRADEHHVAALIRDVTEQKVTERVLKDAKATAESIVAARTEFMGHLSHDIRNAMTGVLTMTDVMLHRSADPATKRYLEIIQRSGEHLVGLVSDIVDFSRLEHGRMSFEARPTDIRSFFADAMDFHTSGSANDALEIRAEIADGTPVSLLVDPFRLRQLLDNVLGNAIKFTEHGEVVVRVRYEGGALEITVRDTGVGMSEEYLAKVFDVFVQAPNRPQGKPHGSGLGLSIARQLATSMGGTIEAQSREGVGSTFRIVVQCAAGAEP